MPRRDWDLSQEEKRQVIERQNGLNGSDGAPLDLNHENEDYPGVQFHHVLPAGHGGIDSDSLDEYGSSIDNFVALNSSSHMEDAHEGRTATFAANASKFPYSHGGNEDEHKAWAEQNDQKWEEAFPNVKKPPIDPTEQDIPDLVNNEAIGSVNDVARTELKNTYDQNPDQQEGREAVMEQISQPSPQNAATNAETPPTDAQQSALAAAQSAQGSSEESSSELPAGQQAVAAAEKARAGPEPATSGSSQEPSSTPSNSLPDDLGP